MVLMPKKPGDHAVANKHNKHKTVKKRVFSLLDFYHFIFWGTS